MAEMMVGREVSFKVEKDASVPGEVVLKVEGLNVLTPRKVLGLKDFSIEVRRGEILGVAGVDGNGQSELVEAVTGMRWIESGRIWLKGKDITHDGVRARIRAGIAHIPEDRHRHGLVLDYTVEDNMILETYDQEPFSHRGLLDRPEIRKYAEGIVSAFDVRAGEGVDSMARSLSGGNQQKAIVGREMVLDPDLLVAVQPTRGLDVGAIEYIHHRLIEQRDSGKAVLLVSLELDEILNVSDRIAVISHGELIGILQADETDENEVGLMMTGVRKGEGQ
jgi:simple sugar transport system ATP-binding protein